VGASNNAWQGEESKTSTCCGPSSLKEEKIGSSPSAQESHQTVERIAIDQGEEEHEGEESSRQVSVSSDRLEDIKSEEGHYHHVNKDASIVASKEASVGASTTTASKGEEDNTSKYCGPSSLKETKFARRPSPPHLSPPQQSRQLSKHPANDDYTKLHLQRSSMTTAPGAVAVGGDGEEDETKDEEEEISNNAILPAASDGGYGGGGDVARMPPQTDPNDNVNDKHTYPGQGTDDYTHVPMITAELVAAPEPMITAELVAPAPPPVEAVTVHIDEVEAVTVHIDEGPPEAEKKTASKRKRAIASGVALLLVIIVVTTLTVTINYDGASTEPQTQTAAGFPYECYQSTLDIIEAQLESADEPATYIICPNSRIQVGKFRNPAAEDFRFVNGDYPIIVIKDNVTIQCGIDGRHEDNCIIEDGLVQVMTIYDFPRPDGTMEPSGPSTDNFKLRGITFTGEMDRNDVFRGASVSLSHPGRNMVFEDCVWENMTATADGIISTAKNLYLDLTDVPLMPHSIELTLLNCRFSNIVYAYAVVANVDQTLNIDRCHFEDFRLTLLLEPCVEHRNGCSGLFYCVGTGVCSISDICVNNFEIAGVAAMFTDMGADFRIEGSNSLQGWTLSPTSDPSDFCEGGLGRLLDDDGNFECIDPFDADSCVLDT
jgi:hypothetical protein